jgi:parallel beta-helix repeat protein
MKTKLLLLGLLTLAATPLQAAWTEILTNGGFESNFTGWTQSAGVVETTEVYNGTKSAKITASTYFKQFYQNIPFTAGRTVQGTGYVKTTGATGNHGMTIQFLDASNAVISEHGIGSSTGTTSWALKTSAVLTSPAGTATLRLRCHAGTNAGGTGYFDLISLQEDVPSGPAITFTPQQYTEQLTNPGFESNWTTWTQGNAALDTTNQRTGVNAAKLTGGGYFKQFYNRRAATAGEVYSASFWAKCATLPSTVSISVNYLDAGAVVLKSYGLGTLRGTRPYRQYGRENLRAPANTAFVEIKITMAKENTAGAAYFDDFSLRKNTGLPIRATATYESIGVTVLTTSTTADCTVYYRATGTTPWKTAIAPYYDGKDTGDRQFRCSIVGLSPDTTYEVYAFVMDGATILAEGGTTVSTWQSSPTVTTTHTVASLYTSGKLALSDLQGAPNAWIKITGTGSADIAAGYAIDEAVLLSNCAYVILENVAITGGRRHGIHVQNSENIRVRNCDVSGWARTPGYVSGGVSYEDLAAFNAGTAINMDAGVYLNNSAQVTVERCYLHDPRLSANNWDYGHPCGAQGITVQNSGTTGNHVIRHNDIIGSDNLRWNDGIEGYDNGGVNGSVARDSDIQGNMICYGQDDSVELDGGQENVRFFENKLVGFMCGMSTAPNVHGPSYIYRNLFTRLGDGRGSTGNLIKQGGGTTYSKGMSYYFNNTLYGAGYAGIAAVGYGSDTNRDMYKATSRNNIIYATSTNTFTIEDPWDVAENDFDYDNLWNVGLTTAKTDYAAGQEPNGTLNAAPVFVALADDDYRLAAASPGLDDGTEVPAFTGTISGAAPDQGAFEGSTAKMFPVRPVAITANKYRLTPTAVANGSSTSVSTTLTTGAISGPVAYTIKKTAQAGWLNVTPASGNLSNNSTQAFTVSVNTAGLTAGTRKGVFLVRLASGLSVPIVVEATITN